MMFVGKTDEDRYVLKMMEIMTRLHTLLNISFLKVSMVHNRTALALTLRNTNKASKNIAGFKWTPTPVLSLSYKE